ncbi:pyrroloquinoline quinone precursor peptide PqqA, partial [Klebsiella pneumoniae]
LRLGLEVTLYISNR